MDGTNEIRYKYQLQRFICMASCQNLLEKYFSGIKHVLDDTKPTWRILDARHEMKTKVMSQQNIKK